MRWPRKCKWKTLLVCVAVALVMIFLLPVAVERKVNTEEHHGRLRALMAPIFYSKGSRFNYSLPEVDRFVEEFKSRYGGPGSNYILDESEPYTVFLGRLNALKKKGKTLPGHFWNRTSQDRFYSHINQYQLYDPDNGNVLQDLLRDLSTRPIIKTEQKKGGTQIKLFLTFDDGSQGIFKPMRFPRDKETLPNHFYFNDFERHTAEIAAFHLDKVLGYHRAVPTVGRVLNITRDVERIGNKHLVKSIFTSPVGNKCFIGDCTQYCMSSFAICGRPELLEGSVGAFLPDYEHSKYKKYHPYRRSYSRTKKTEWQTNPNYCEERVKTDPMYKQGRLLLNLMDLSVFDYLTGNLDRHHFESFKQFGNDTSLVHLDQGRAFGKSYYDCHSCLAPVSQCCLIRLSTLAKLVKLYQGPDSLSHVLRTSMASDPLNPILWEPHLDALDRRVGGILKAIDHCIKSKSSERPAWEQVVIDDGVT